MLITIANIIHHDTDTEKTDLCLEPDLYRITIYTKDQHSVSQHVSFKLLVSNNPSNSCVMGSSLLLAVCVCWFKQASVK